MSGFTTQTIDHFIRSDIWSRDIKDYFEAELYAQKYVHWLTDFGDGDTLHIPSIGQAQVLDFDEGQAIRYTSFNTGDFTFSIDQYKSSATYITDKFKQDSMWAAQLASTIVPKQTRALLEVMEAQVWQSANGAQTSGNGNSWNGVNHRWVAQGTNGVLSPKDFARAKYALQKAYVPMTNLVAIVDPSVEFYLSTLTGLSDVVYNPRWEGIIRDGMSSTGMKFLVNIYGFDVYTSEFLPKGLTETISSSPGGTTSVSGDGVANLFFSAAGGDANPFIGAVRQAPRFESERNKDLQRDEYVMTTRYGFGFYRPENMVIVLSDESAALA